MTRGLPRHTIARGMNRPKSVPSGTVPDVGTAMLDYFQPLQMTTITKGVLGFQAIETGVVTKFRGVVQPFTGRQLLLKPEGQRAWNWMTLFSEPVLTLDVDDIMTFLGKDTRVMARKDFALYGYLVYELVQDWTGSGPLT